jgi:thiol-disulfide isomerase/thioredoxin
MPEGARQAPRAGAKVSARLARWLAFAVAAGIALAAGLYFGQRHFEEGAGGGRDAGALLAIALPDADGKEQPLGQWKGKVVVVNFWATWCAPCREEMPEFVRLQQELGPKGLQFVGIAIDQADKVGQFAGEIGLNYPALIGGYGAMELSKTLGNAMMALPFTVIVDRSGRIAHTQLGPLREDKLRGIVGQLL